jgi:sulfopyruvate decarboxylase TPP-binding subunit
MADPQNTSYLERLAALRLLRENIYYSQPSRYAATDIADDLPGPMRAIAPSIGEIAPSMAIISKDPEERKAQIREAIKKIKQTGDASTSLGKEILHNVKTMGLGALGPGFALATAFNLMGFRSPIAKLKSGKKTWRSPITPVENFKKLFNKPGYAKEIAKESGKEALTGAGIAAASAGLYPLFARAAKPSDKALSEAAESIQNQPTITSIPAAEFMSLIRRNESDENSPTIKNLKAIGQGAGIGAGIGVAGALAPSALKLLAYAAKNAITRKPLSADMGGILKKDLPRDLRLGGITGGLLGAAAGPFTEKLPANEQT